MRRKLLLVGLALGLMFTGIMPAPALAKSRESAPAPFQGFGAIFSANWDQFSSRPTRDGYILRYQGEQVPGVLAFVQGWPDLQGAMLSSTHDSTVLVDKSGNIIRGHMEGEFQLATAAGTLEGHFSADIVGGILNPLTGAIYAVHDEGKWRSTRGTGVFEDVRADGDWSLLLDVTAYPDVTDVLQWGGQYIKSGDREGKNDDRGGRH